MRNQIGFLLNPPEKTMRQQIRFLTGSEDSSLPTFVVITEDSHLFCINSLYTYNSCRCPSITLVVLFNDFPKLHWDEEDIKEDKGGYMKLISLSQLVLLSHSLPLCPFLTVCQMEFMYLIYLWEWATVETKALRHILQAGTLFKKQIDLHTCSVQAHAHTHIVMQVHAFVHF